MLNSFTFSQLGGSAQRWLEYLIKSEWHCRFTTCLTATNSPAQQEETPKRNELWDNSKLIFALQCSNLTERWKKKIDNETLQVSSEGSADGSCLYLSILAQTTYHLYLTLADFFVFESISFG